MYGALPDGAVSDNGVLRIQNTQSIHGGTYTCTGKNAFSDDMASVQLRVGGKKSSALKGHCHFGVCCLWCKMWCPCKRKGQPCSQGLPSSPWKRGWRRRRYQMYFSRDSKPQFFWRFVFFRRKRFCCHVMFQSISILARHQQTTVNSFRSVSSSAIIFGFSLMRRQLSAFKSYQGTKIAWHSPGNPGSVINLSACVGLGLTANTPWRKYILPRMDVLAYTAKKISWLKYTFEYFVGMAFPSCIDVAKGRWSFTIDSNQFLIDNWLKRVAEGRWVVAQLHYQTPSGCISRQQWTLFLTLTLAGSDSLTGGGSHFKSVLISKRNSAGSRLPNHV